MMLTDSSPDRNLREIAARKKFNAGFKKLRGSTSLDRMHRVAQLSPDAFWFESQDVFDTAETYFRLSAAATKNNLRGPEREQFIIQGLVENGVIDSGDSQEAVRGYKVVREGCELNRYHWQNMLGKMTRNSKRR